MYKNRKIMRLTCLFMFASLSNYAHAIEKADHVLVDKSDGALILLKDGVEIGSFSVAFGANPEGHKQQEGDERTPEGRYILDYKKADSAFHKAIHISYPNKTDIEKAKKLGVSPGGAVMIHGQKNGFGWAAPILQFFNWTDGCIALKDSDMDLVWLSVDSGTPIEIRP